MDNEIEVTIRIRKDRMRGLIQVINYGLMKAGDLLELSPDGDWEKGEREIIRGGAIELDNVHTKLAAAWVEGV